MLSEPILFYAVNRLNTFSKRDRKGIFDIFRSLDHESSLYLCLVCQRLHYLIKILVKYLPLVNIFLY